jgi:signal transduction histidine kinase
MTTKDDEPVPDFSGSFFREVEIEFLIHELKDPVAVIETGLRALLEKQDKYGPLSPRQEKILKRSLRNSHKARAMLSNLLEIGRSQAGCFFCCSFKPVRSAHSVLLEALDALAGDLSEQYRTFAEERQAVDFLAHNGILLEIAPQLEQVEVHQDETKFRQIVGNLIKNALHHRKSRVVIRMGLEGDQLLVDVTDDGPGIDPVNHRMIFQRYRQVRECRLIPRNGHGLGLAGARIMARCLGGDVEVESRLGQGATFRLRLPVTFDSGTDG